MGMPIIGQLNHVAIRRGDPATSRLGTAVTHPCSHPPQILISVVPTVSGGRPPRLHPGNFTRCESSPPNSPKPAERADVGNFLP